MGETPADNPDPATPSHGAEVSPQPAEEALPAATDEAAVLTGAGSEEEVIEPVVNAVENEKSTGSAGEEQEQRQDDQQTQAGGAAKTLSVGSEGYDGASASADIDEPEVVSNEEKQSHSAEVAEKDAVVLGTETVLQEEEEEAAIPTGLGLFGTPDVPPPPPPGSKDGLKEILETTRLLEAKERGLGRKYLREAIAARQEPVKKTLCGDSSSMVSERCGDSSAMVTENHHTTAEFFFCLNGAPKSECCDEEAGEPQYEHEASVGDVGSHLHGAWDEGKADDGDHDSAEDGSVEAIDGPTQAEAAKQYWAETRAMEEAEAELAKAAAAISDKGTSRRVSFRGFRKASARATGFHGLFKASSSKKLAQLKTEAEAAAPTARAP